MKMIRIEFWWFFERLASRLWQHTPREPMDSVTAFTYRKRKNAEFAVYGPKTREQIDADYLSAGILPPIEVVPPA